MLRDRFWFLASPRSFQLWLPEFHPRFRHSAPAASRVLRKSAGRVGNPPQDGILPYGAWA